MKNFILVLIGLITLHSQAYSQIDLINDNIGIGTLNPDVPIHLKGDTYKFQNEAGASLFQMNSAGNIGIGTNPTIHKLTVNGNVSIAGRNMYLGNNRLYGDNSSLINYYSNHSTVTQLIMSDKEGTGYGRLYGDGNGSNFGLLDGDGQWSYRAIKDSHTQFRINNIVQMQIEPAAFWVRPSQIQVAQGQTGNRYSYIDFVGDDSYTDYGLRLIRHNSGPNTTSSLAHRGTGPLEIVTQDAGDLHLMTNYTHRLTVKAASGGGNIGIGLTNPSQKLHVNGSIQYTGSLINASDKRLKKNIGDFEYGIAEVVRLNPVSYQYIEDVSDKSGRRSVGLIAQELAKVAPELVTSFTMPARESMDQQTEKSLEDYLAIEESSIKYMLINAIKEQQAQIDEQGQMIKELQESINSVGAIDRAFENSIDIALSNSKDDQAPFLSQNIPNPTKEQAKIKYFVPEFAHSATIRFYNLSGQVLKEVDISKNGQGQINLELEQMISGSYMYSLIVDGELIDTKKMVIVR